MCEEPYQFLSIAIHMLCHSYCYIVERHVFTNIMSSTLKYKNFRFFFWASCSNHCLAALDLGIGRCWAAIWLSHRPDPSGHVVNGEVDGLDIRGQHGRRFVLLRHTQAAKEAVPHLYKQERKRPTLVWRRLSQTQALLGRAFRGVGASVGDENAESCGVVQPLHIPLVIHPLRRTYVVVARKTDEMLCSRYKWVSRFEALCVCTWWTGKHWVEQMSSLHGTTC